MKRFMEKAVLSGRFGFSVDTASHVARQRTSAELRRFVCGDYLSPGVTS